MYDVIIIGGGLAGLVNAIMLARYDRRVLLIERKSYPFHRVCGEYVSNEVIPFLNDIHSFPGELEPSRINKFQLSSVSGKSVTTRLEMGGFGISRFAFDQFLSQKAADYGAEIRINTIVRNVIFKNDYFQVFLSDGDPLMSRVVVGAFGKRSVLDKTLDRDFIKKRSPFIGVKYHMKMDFPDDTIALHNFDGGYCGILKIEGDRYNLCYLASRQLLKKVGDIQELESKVLRKNPWLNTVFRDSDVLFDQPLVINEVSFAAKEPVLNHIIMPGDSAGMIAPLCGNGMAMAIHSAKMSAEEIQQYLLGHSSRRVMEKKYKSSWTKKFARRLWIGRTFQDLFGTGRGSDAAVSLLSGPQVLSNWIIRRTHGKPF